MKRSNRIVLHRFRKTIHAFPLTPVALAISCLFLTGCDDSTSYTAGSDVDSQSAVVGIFKNAEECIEKYPSERQACEAGYQRALSEAQRTAPHYASDADCVADFGQENCTATGSNTAAQTAQADTTSTQQSSASSHNSFLPLMAGFMIGRAAGNFSSGNAQPLFSSSNPTSPAHNRFVDSSGRSYGSSRETGRFSAVPSSALKDKPAPQSFTRRGGFGNMVNAQTAAANNANRNQLRPSMRNAGSSSSRGG